MVSLIFKFTLTLAACTEQNNTIEGNWLHMCTLIIYSFQWLVTNLQYDTIIATGCENTALEQQTLILSHENIIHCRKDKQPVLSVTSSLAAACSPQKVSSLLRERSCSLVAHVPHKEEVATFPLWPSHTSLTSSGHAPNLRIYYKRRRLHSNITYTSLIVRAWAQGSVLKIILSGWYHTYKVHGQQNAVH